jgi:hypothetical protein
MSNFAQVVDGIVTQVIVAERDVIASFPNASSWYKTSYNTRGGIHYGQDGSPDNGIAFRGNYAGIGNIYDKSNNVFYDQKPYASWILNQNTWTWEAPITMPTTGGPYQWDEATTSWVE